MNLLSDELVASLPALGATEGQEDPLVVCKFFHADSPWTWYAIEYDGDDLFFGWVNGDEQELGYFRRSDLEAQRGVFGLPIERDLSFRPCPLSHLLMEA